MLVIVPRAGITARGGINQMEGYGQNMPWQRLWWSEPY